jgi:hypothetical protein
MRKLRILMIAGILAAIAGYATMNTTLVLAYRGGTLANVHALCANAFVQALSHGSGACSSINGWYTLATVALWGGLLLAGIGLLAWLVQRGQPHSEQN